MHHYSRWKTASILGVTVLVCLAAVPSALPASAFAQLPAWAQRKFVLGYDLAGGSRIQFEVDRAFIYRQHVERLRDEMRHLLRDHRIPYAGLAIREGGAEVTIREDADMARAVQVFGEYARPRLLPPGPAPYANIQVDG